MSFVSGGCVSRRTGWWLILVPGLLAGLWWLVGLESNPPVAPEPIAEAAPAPPPPAAAKAESSPARATLPKADVGQPVSPQAQQTPELTAQSQGPVSHFQDAEYSQSRMEIYVEFYDRARTWSLDDYRRQRVRREALDGREAYQAYVFLRTCLETPRTRQALDRRLQAIEQDRQGNPENWNPEQYRTMVQRWEEGLARCEGLDDLEQPLEAVLVDWLTHAADQGYGQAQLAYYQSARWLLGRQQPLIYRQPERLHEYRHKARAYLERALSTGHPEAFAEWAMAYIEGVIVPHDPLQAYAHAHAADLASHGQNTAARGFAAIAEAELEPDGMRQAREIGRSLCDRYCR